VPPSCSLEIQSPGSSIGRDIMLRLLTVHASQSVDDSPPASDAKGAPSMTFSLTSPAFPDGGEIPNRYTCEGRDVSPPLTWSEPPSGTKSLALIVDDPDAPDPKAPKMTWVHWVLYNLPPTVGQLAEAVERKALPTGTREGLNDWKRTGYGGPCPPIGRHRYFHKLYALDTVLPDLGRPTKAQLEKAMQGHVLAGAELVGTYEKKGH
jgi:Raf kinase inhibitor-like YbhB/YbcL family protein